MKKLQLSLAILFGLSTSIAFAQTVQEYAISDGGVQNSDNCQEYFVLTDSNADNGDYDENENYEITLCLTDIEMSSAQVAILPTDPATGSVWDVDDNSSLFIYEGTGTAGTLLGEFNSVSDPEGVFFTTNASCLTFVFISGAGSSGAGFVAEIKCVEPRQPFDLTVVPQLPQEWSTEDFEGIPDEAFVLTICYGDTVRFNSILDFPLSDATGNGYEQSLETTTITYSWGDNSSDSGLGLDEGIHAYEPEGGFYVIVSAEDEMGQIETVEIYVLVSPRPDFSGFLFDDILCLGDTTRITGGILDQDTVGVGPSSGIVNLFFEFNDSLALPDGSGVLYSTTVDVFGYSGSPTLQDLDDLESICLNMEHSYLGDLEAWITCPDGSTSLLFDGFGGTGQYPNGETGFGGGNTFLGDPVDNDGTPDVQGAGFDYCFSSSFADLGTMADEHAAGNTTPVTTGNAMVEGVYLPSEGEGFENLIGCPLNGPWTLSIADNIGSDNGFIFGWNITFADEFARDTIKYSPDIVDAYWLDNSDIIANNDTIITVLPSSPGNNSFTFIAEDSFGCLHDTTFVVFVRPEVQINNAIACDLTHTLTPVNDADGGVWEVLSTPSENSTVSFNPTGNGADTEITVNEYGLYTFEITENSECAYTDQAVIDFRPDPQVAPLISDTTLCSGAEIVLDAGPQLPNSDNFSVIWTRNGNQVANGVYSYTADETGLYVVEIAGVCGTASDTTDVTSINIVMEGNTICGKQTFGSVNVTPDGTGVWSAESEDISFSNANLQSTQISSQNFGLYNITYTDSRCVNDGETREFRFVDQPTIVILPEMPDFCVDSDSLMLTATITGSAVGTAVTWTTNGIPEFDLSSDTIVYPPNTFPPLDENVVTATADDPFGVCPPGTGSISFEGDWCNYTIPNVITINGDGRNDFFHILGLEFIRDARLKVYDRWGTLVFENNDYGQYQLVRGAEGGWDPKDNGTGTYFYELTLPTISEQESGYVQVLDGSAD